MRDILKIPINLYVVGCIYMNTIKKAGLITIVITITLVALILTHTFLPGYIKSRGGLYTSWEKGQWHLTNDDYDELVIEYDYVRNYSPNYTATQTFDEILRNYTDKEEITHTRGDTIAFLDTRRVYDRDDIFYLKNKYQDKETNDNVLSIHVLYLDGRWKEEDVLGLSYGGTNIVIFKETITKSAYRSPGVGVNDIESSVLIHEWGHLIGLVGKDYDSEHECPDYPKHCNLEAGECVMAASVEIDSTGMGKAPPTNFCELCQRDIEKIRTMNDPFDIANILTYIAMFGESAIGITWMVTITKQKDNKQKGLYNQNLNYQNTNYVKEDDTKEYY